MENTLKNKQLNIKSLLLILPLLFLSACSTHGKFTLNTQSEQMYQKKIATCHLYPSSQTCTQGIQYNLHQQARQLNSKEYKPLKNLLNIIYNGSQAESLFLQRVPDIDTRADFFASNHHYFQSTDMPVRWFGVSEKISRRCLKGLGAKGCGSKLTFAMAKGLTNPNLYDWRQAVGDEILQQGFSNFQDLFNNHHSDPKAWDIKQLKREQAIAQPLHEKYLPDHPAFIQLTKVFGVNMLDEEERVNYGCRLMKYQCVPK